MTEEISKLRDETMKLALSEVKRVLNKEVINQMDYENLTRLQSFIDIVKHI